jgi:hypothetical protein
MPGATSLGRTLVAAGVAHAAVAVLILVQKPRIVSHELEVQKLVWVDSTPEEAPVEPTPPEPVGAELAKQDKDLTDPLRRDRQQPETAAVSSAVVLPESATPTPGGWTLRVTAGQAAPAASQAALEELALDGKNHFMGRRQAPMTPEDAEKEARAEGNRQAGGAMRAALHDHDVAMGLGGGGPVVTALEAALRESTAPLESHAILVAVANAAGVVTQVDVESASDDPASFRAVAEDVLSRLRGQNVRVPAGHGLSMRLDVVSRVGAPSGGGVGLDPKSAGGHFDLSDIGARPKRIIHAHVLTEDVL